MLYERYERILQNLTPPSSTWTARPTVWEEPAPMALDTYRMMRNLGMPKERVMLKMHAAGWAEADIDEAVASEPADISAANPF